MRHIVFVRRVVEGKGWGGCEIRLCEYFKRADYGKVRITVVTNADIYTPKLKGTPAKVNVAVTELSGGPSFLGRLKVMKNILKPLKADQIVFVQGANTDFLAGDIYAGRQASKGNVLMLEVLGSEPPPAKPVKTYFGIIPAPSIWWHMHVFKNTLKGKWAKKILTSSRAVKDRLVKWYNYPSEKVIPIFHGVDVTRFRPDDIIRKEMRQEYGVTDTDIVFVSTARLSAEKKLDCLIEGFARAAEGKDNMKLFIVGDGDQRPALEALAQKSPAAGKIVFTGFTDDVSRYLKMSDVYMLVSDVEGLGIALLEAMACQLVCVATRTAGPTELISNTVDGYLIDKGSEAAEAVIELIMNIPRGYMAEMGLAAREKVVSYFDKEERVAFAMNELEIPSASEGS